MSKTQLKLMAALAALVLLVVAVFGVLAERSLRERELARLANSLEERSALVLELARGAPLHPGRMAELDAIADRAGAAARARVTLIGPDGTVVADSDVTPERLPGVVNHAGRPEVREALAGGVGRSARRSETVGRRLFYLAVPVGGGAGGVVRLAVDLSDLEAAVAELRGELLAAGAVGLVAALALSYALAWFTTRPLRQMRRVAASIAGGELDHRMPRRSGDELGDISGAIDRMAEQLRQHVAEATGEKERLQAVLNAMVEGVLVVDAKGGILMANARLREFYGVPGEVEGRTALEAIRDAELDEVLAEATRTDEAVSRAVSVARPVARTLRIQAVRFPSGRAPRMGTVAVFHDVTELARLEKVRRDFIANASHELRTPLAAIRGFTETLLQNGGLAPADRRSYLEIIDRHSRRLGHLVGDLLELSRIESGEASLELAAVDAAALAQSLIGDSRPSYAEKGLEVSVDASGASVAWADPRAVEQILGNLLDNAVKYTQSGGRIAVKIEGEDGRVRIGVSDNGIGIPGSDLARIFERFYRVDKARSRELGGTGLGLSIVKHLVQRLGGEISVESELGKGSTFWFTLPVPLEIRESAPR
ncbi:MAG: ATP-binding protein [Myxococcota bacterium]